MAICSETTGVPLDPDDGWSLDIDRVADAIRPNTRLVTINFPHNPTGAILPLDRYEALIDAVPQSMESTFCMTRSSTVSAPSGTRHLPFVADLYERGLSLNVMSKSYGLPGLRIGWIASQDTDAPVANGAHETLPFDLQFAGPSEQLALIALKNRDLLLARNCAIVG